jgi:hypothetical protein
MATKLIRLEDGTRIEVEATAADAEEVAHGAELIKGVSIDDIRPLVLRVTKPLVEVWRELNQDMEVEGAEVELGLGFEGEGNLFVTKAKGSANFLLRLRLAPKPAAAAGAEKAAD